MFRFKKLKKRRVYVHCRHSTDTLKDLRSLKKATFKKVSSKNKLLEQFSSLYFFIAESWMIATLFFVYFRSTLRHFATSFTRKPHIKHPQRSLLHHYSILNSIDFSTWKCPTVLPSSLTETPTWFNREICVWKNKKRGRILTNHFVFYATMRHTLTQVFTKNCLAKIRCKNLMNLNFPLGFFWCLSG